MSVSILQLLLITIMLYIYISVCTIQEDFNTIFVISSTPHDVLVLVIWLPLRLPQQYFQYSNQTIKITEENDLPIKSDFVKMLEYSVFNN